MAEDKVLRDRIRQLLPRVGADRQRKVDEGAAEEVAQDGHRRLLHTPGHHHHRGRLRGAPLLQLQLGEGLQEVLRPRAVQGVSIKSGA